MDSQVFYSHPPPVKPGLKNVRFPHLTVVFSLLALLRMQPHQLSYPHWSIKTKRSQTRVTNSATKMLPSRFRRLQLSGRIQIVSPKLQQIRWRPPTVAMTYTLTAATISDDAGNDSDGHDSSGNLFSPIKQDGYSTDANPSLDPNRRARIPEIEVKNMDRFQGDLLPELGSETVPLSQLSAANGTRLPASQHSCRATGDGQRHAAGEVVWEHGDLISYRVRAGRTEVLVPWLPTWEAASEYPPKAVARVRRKRRRGGTMPATTMREMRKPKARGRPRRPRDIAPKAPLSFKRSLRYGPE